MMNQHRLNEVRAMGITRLEALEFAAFGLEEEELIEALKKLLPGIEVEFPDYEDEYDHGELLPALGADVEAIEVKAAAV
jgi:hypothetical protein